MSVFTLITDESVIAGTALVAGSVIVGADTAFFEADVADIPRAILHEEIGSWLNIESLQAVDNGGTRYHFQLLSAAVRSGETSTGSVRLLLVPRPALTVDWIDIQVSNAAPIRLRRSQSVEATFSPTSDASGWGRCPDDVTELLDRFLFARPGVGETYAGRRTLLANRLSSTDDLLASESEDAAREQSGSSASRPSSTWANLLMAAEESDGRLLHVDLAATDRQLGELTLAPGSLRSRSTEWSLFLAAKPTWFNVKANRREAPSTVATDDRGGRYLSRFGGSVHSEEGDWVRLRFRPRLDPLARQLHIAFFLMPPHTESELSLVIELNQL